jgi:hypothetical protein
MQNDSDSTKDRLGSKFLKPFCFLFITTSIAAFLLYFGLALMTKETEYFSPIVVTDILHFGYLREITEHPFAFLLTISFFVSLLGAFWGVAIATNYRRFHWLQLLTIPWIALIVTSPVWGVIWSIYRWPPQSFSDSSTMMLFYRHDAIFGLTLGWLSAIISFPINILSYAIVCLLLFFSKKLFLGKHLALEATK